MSLGNFLNSKSNSNFTIDQFDSLRFPVRADSFVFLSLDTDSFEQPLTLLHFSGRLLLSRSEIFRLSSQNTSLEFLIP